MNNFKSWYQSIYDDHSNYPFTKAGLQEAYSAGFSQALEDAIGEIKGLENQRLHGLGLSITTDDLIAAISNLKRKADAGKVEG